MDTSRIRSRETTTSELLSSSTESKIVKALNAIEAPGIEQEGRLTEFVGTPRSSHRSDEPAAEQSSPIY